MSAEAPDPPASVGELLTSPQKVVAIWLLVLALRMLRVQLVVPSGAAALAAGKASIIGAPPNLILQLPFKFTSAVAAASGNSPTVSSYSSTTGTAGSYSSATGATSSYSSTTFGATYTGTEQTKLNTLSSAVATLCTNDAANITKFNTLSSAVATLVTNYNALVTKFNTLSTSAAALVTAHNTAMATLADSKTQLNAALAELRKSGINPGTGV